MISDYSHRDIHCDQLLAEQFARIRDFHIGELCLVVACLAMVNMHFVIVCRNHSTSFAHVYLELV